LDKKNIANKNKLANYNMKESSAACGVPAGCGMSEPFQNGSLFTARFLPPLTG
jgi:hypothetical protein